MSKKEIVAESTETDVSEATSIAEKKTREKTKSRENVKSSVSVMYIGPNIPNVVRTSTVFKDGVYSEALKKIIKERPYVEKLLVPINSLAEARKELAKENSALSVIYNKVKNNI